MEAQDKDVRVLNIGAGAGKPRRWPRQHPEEV